VVGCHEHDGELSGSGTTELVSFGGRQWQLQKTFFMFVRERLAL
jgi:hypothetical protein